MSIDHTFDPVSGLKQLQDEVDANLSGLFAEPVQWILNGGGNIQALLDQVQECLPTTISTEQAHLVATWCCVEALRRVPQWETWKIVQKLQDNSWFIENWLIDVVCVVIEKEPVKKQDFIILAQAVISETDCLFLQEPTEENQETRPIQEKLSWQQHDKPLQEIWWEIDRSYYPSYRRISDWFYVLTRLDKTQAALTLESLKNPFLVQQLIARVGMLEDNHTHKSWQYFMQEAPAAFEANGAWTGHILAPLMLAWLRSYLLRHTANYGSTEEEKAQSKEQIKQWVSDNIPTISQRSDAIPLLKRWSAWLMYRLLVEGGDKAEDVSSSAFVDVTLLTAIGHLFTEKTPNLAQVSPDALHWEHWCNLANGSYWAQNGVAIDYDYQAFLKE